MTKVTFIYDKTLRTQVYNEAVSRLPGLTRREFDANAYELGLLVLQRKYDLKNAGRESSRITLKFNK